MHSLVEVREVGEYLTVHVCGGWASDSQITRGVVKLDEERGLGGGEEEGGGRRGRGRREEDGGRRWRRRVGREKEEANGEKEGHVLNLLALYNFVFKCDTKVLALWRERRKH